MGREVRMVPQNWQHPKDDRGRYKPLYGRSYAIAAEEFMEKAKAEGLQEAIDWFGQAPDQNDYMPDWPAEERTHYMMYEDTSEGTPISPSFKTPEELAKWLTETGASAFGNSTATYEGWLRVAKGGFACSAVVQCGVMVNGVDGLSR